MAFCRTMKRGIFGMACLVSASAAGAEMQRGPVVVELYTSQGCSACPPADEMLHTLSKRDDVIALAMHVDYWDYIGWKDSFARPEHAERQRGFAARSGQNMVYTPQMVIDGTSQVVGNKPMDVTDVVMKHAQTPDPVQVTMTRQGDTLTIRARGEVSEPVDVHLVRFDPQRSVHITRGENRGKTISYSNIVQDWQVVHLWDGAKPLRLRATIKGDAPAAVLIQERNHGSILGAAAVR